MLGCPEGAWRTRLLGPGACNLLHQISSLPWPIFDSTSFQIRCRWGADLELPPDLLTWRF